MKLFMRSKRPLHTERSRPWSSAFVRGLSVCDVESLCEEAGLGQVSKSTASRIGEGLGDRFRAVRERDLCGVRLEALFLDATYPPVRRSGAKESVLCAWGSPKLAIAHCSRSHRHARSRAGSDLAGVRLAYWRALDEGTGRGRQARLRTLIGEL